MRTKLGMMDSRCGTTRGVSANSREVEVYDADGKLIRTFGSVRELELKSEKYLGVNVGYQTISIHCRNGKLYEGKYKFKMKENYIF